MHADRWGPLGSVFAALCCLGAAPVVGAVTAVGGLWLSGVVVGVGLALLVAASVWNRVLVRRLREASVSPGRRA